MVNSTTDYENVIYGLYCVCEKCDDRREWIRYVGQTIKTARERLAKHLSEALNPNIPGVMYPKNRWIRKHRAENIRVKTLEVVPSRGSLNEREKYWIRVYDSDNHRSGGLNLTPGGDSASHRRRGENAPGALLTEKEVSQIKRALWSGDMPIQVSRAFGVNPSTVHSIDKGRKWVHVPWPVGPRERTREAEYRSEEARKRWRERDHPMRGLSIPRSEEVKKILSEKTSESWRGGTRKPRKTLSATEREAVKRAVESGDSRKDIATRFDISTRTITRIVHGTI